MIAEIKTMEYLKKNLHMGPGYGGYIEILKALNLPKMEWEKFCSWKVDKYTRNCISSCDDYELLLLCWQAEQSSPIHSYNFQEGWVKILKGELQIDSYDVDLDNNYFAKKDTMVLKEGESTYLNDNMGFHKVSNITQENAVSLHLNIGPVKEWNVYNEFEKTIEIIEPSIDKTHTDCD